jgi:DNA-directed RNA polymerase specialized sigma subunit
MVSFSQPTECRFFAYPVRLHIMSAVLLGKRCVGGVQDGQNGIALSDEQDFERLLETALPLVRPFVRRIRRKLPRNFEVDELESVAMTGLLAAARDYRALQDGNFVGYAITRIRGAILDELRQTDWGPRRNRSSDINN